MATNKTFDGCQNIIFQKTLQSLKRDVTTNDRLAAEKELRFTRGTISKYLNGIVRNNDTAASLIAFFRNRIAERAKVLA